MGKGKSCFFIGHKNLDTNKITKIKKHLEDEIINLINQGVTNFYSGGLIGFDLLAAETIINLKSQFPNITLSTVIAYEDQYEDWTPINQQRYFLILRESDKINILSNNYYNNCILIRHKYVIESSNYCIAYIKISFGDTFYGVSYAQKCEIPIINLAD